MFISIIIAVFTLSVPIIPFSKLRGFYADCGKGFAVGTTIILFVMFLAIVFAVVAFKNLYGAYKLKPFKGVNYQSVGNEEILKVEVNSAEKMLIDHYMEILTDNSAENDKKCRLIQLGFKYSVISVSLLILSTIALVIVIGG